MEFKGHIKTIFDAFVLGEAVNQCEIKGVVVRPDISKRSKIYHGMTIVYNETVSGIKRWTDGKVWSTSKFYNGFFVYEDKSLTTNMDNSELKLFKKVLTMVSPTNQHVHIINYFYNDTARDDNVSKLKRPMDYPLKNMSSIITNAKKYRYFKCFRSKSSLWKKLYYAPEVERNMAMGTDKEIKIFKPKYFNKSTSRFNVNNMDSLSDKSSSSSEVRSLNHLSISPVRLPSISFLLNIEGDISNSKLDTRSPFDIQQIEKFHPSF